jgi:predicted DNA-binding protein with PD1-like motif
MRSHHFGDGRHLLRLDPGEELLEVLAQFCRQEGIAAGHLTGLGSLDQAVLGFLDPEANEYVKRRFEERLEIGHLTGTISVEGDRPHLHLHAVLAPRELLAYAGHLHAARVGALVEVFLTALPGRLERHAVPGRPYPALLLPGERVPADEGALGP